MPRERGGIYVAFPYPAREMGWNEFDRIPEIRDHIRKKAGAGDGTRTHDFLLGKQTLYR